MSKKETKQETENVVKRGFDATMSCASSLKRIFVALGAKLAKGHMLRKAGATFLAILGWLFIAVAAPGLGGFVLCDMGVNALKPAEEAACESSSSDSQQSSPESSEQSEDDSNRA